MKFADRQDDRRIMDMKSPPEYVCPLCLNKLNQDNNLLCCSSCQKEFPVLENIPILSNRKDYYWNPIAKERMEAILGEGKDEPWHKFVNKLFDQFDTDDIRTEQANMIFRESRAAWKFLTDLTRRGRALDIGCGMGVVAMNLSRTFQSVFAMDMTLERLMLLEKIKRESKIDNLNLVYGGDTEYLPFPSEYFDLVSLIGVLEWVPSNYKDQRESYKSKLSKAADIIIEPWFKSNPKAMQMKMLKEIHRILKPTGTLFLAIENRYDFHYFYKTPDTHTDLLYGSLLPRVFANLYSLVVKRTSYRNYTHSYMGLGKMLRKSGFRYDRFYSMKPDYRIFDEIIDLNNDGAKKNYWIHGSNDGFKEKLYGNKYVCPCFGIVAGKMAQQDGFVERMLDILKEKQKRVFVIKKFIVKSKGSVVLDVRASDDFKQGLIVKMPVDAVSDEQDRKQYRALRNIHESYPLPEDIKALIPVPLLAENIAGQNIYVETRLEGLEAIYLKTEQDKLYRVITDGLAFITKVHKATQKKHVMSEKEYVTGIGRLVKEVLGIGGNQKEVEQGIDSVMRDLFVEKERVYVLKHGDFSVANLLYSKETYQLTGIIDWDNSEFHQPFLIDVINLIESIYNVNDIPMGTTIVDVFLRSKLRAEEKEMLRSYLAAFNETEEIILPYTVLYWLFHIKGQMKYRFLRYDRRWMQENYYNVVEDLRRLYQ